MYILGFFGKASYIFIEDKLFLVDLMSLFGFCSDFITEDYTETHYTSDGTPVITKPVEMVGGCLLAL